MAEGVRLFVAVFRNLSRSGFGSGFFFSFAPCLIQCFDIDTPFIFNVSSWCINRPKLESMGKPKRRTALCMRAVMIHYHSIIIITVLYRNKYCTF